MMKKVVRDFECAMCGRCCASQDLVGLSTYELYGLANHVKMKPTAFFDKYCLVTATSLDPSRRLYIGTSNGVCPFLEDNKCGVYEARPYACRAYPMRVYWSLAGDMKAFVRSRYKLEEACGLFKLDDGDVLLGDYELLAKQAIARWTDDAYFGTACEVLDLSIPYRVADYFIRDEELMNIAKRYVVDPDHSPSGRDAGLAYAKISLTLHAAMWNVTSALVPIYGQAVNEDERIGKYMLLSTDADSVRALRILVESGRLDLARALAIASNVHCHIVAAIHGSSSDDVALGFLFEADKAALEELTDNGNKPLHVFFTAEGATDGKLAGFQLNIKI